MGVEMRYTSNGWSANSTLLLETTPWTDGYWLQRPRANAEHRRNRALQIFFYSNEGVEPPHVHIRRERATAKFWLDPVALSSASGFRRRS